MKMNKSKRLAAVQKQSEPYVVAYGISTTSQHVVPLKPRYGPHQFRWHLENLAAMAKTSKNLERHVSITLFLAGVSRFLWLGNVIYENRNCAPALRHLVTGLSSVMPWCDASTTSRSTELSPSNKEVQCNVT